MPDKKYLLIINPTAGSDKACNQAEKIISLLKKKNINFDFKFTQRPQEAIDIAKNARNNYDVVVAVGGDGTICEVITGLFLDNESGAKPRLGVLHVGTSPDFNKNHNIPTKLEGALQVLLQNKTKSIDIGKITSSSRFQENQKIVSYFASNVNIGLGPLIAGKANARYRKYLGDFLGTLTALLISLAGFKKMNLTISVEGQKLNFNRLLNLTIGKDPYLASGMRVFSQIKPDDGRLYVLSIVVTSWLAFLSNIPKLYCGNFLDYPGARITYARKVEIDYCKDYPLVEFDGDVKGYLPATIEVLPSSLEVIVA